MANRGKRQQISFQFKEALHLASSEERYIKKAVYHSQCNEKGKITWAVNYLINTSISLSLIFLNSLTSCSVKYRPLCMGYHSFTVIKSSVTELDRLACAVVQGMIDIVKIFHLKLTETQAGSKLEYADSTWSLFSLMEI